MTDSSTYPETLDTFNIAFDGTKKLSDALQNHSDTHDWIGDALNKIEAELGVNPSQAAATVAAFLAAIPIAKLAGYPEDSTKVLKGDGTWGAPGAMAEIADNSVTSAKIAAETIVNADVSPSASIAASKLANYPADATRHLKGDGSWSVIHSTEIGTGEISNAHISPIGGITGDKIATGTLTGANIATGTITTENIADGTIANADIRAATILGDKIASNTIAGSNLQNHTITGAQIAGGTISGDNIAASAITNANISAVGGITGDKIATGTIGTEQISTTSGSAIRAGNIESGTIGDAQISASAAIAQSKIAGSGEYDNLAAYLSDLEYRVSILEQA